VDCLEQYTNNPRCNKSGVACICPPGGKEKLSIKSIDYELFPDTKHRTAQDADVLLHDLADVTVLF
jgi:hypothetical protein